MGYRWLNWVTPNQLTLSRIAAVPVLMGLVYMEMPLGNFLALGVFILAGLTDYVDGNLARYRGEVSQLGRMLDPLADKMLVTGSLVTLVSIGKADAVPTIVILMREFAVSGLRQVAAMDGIHIQVVRGAKWKTGFQMFAISALLIHHDPFGIPAYMLGTITLWLAMVVTLLTGVGYFTDYFRGTGPHAPKETAPPTPGEEAIAPPEDEA